MSVIISYLCNHQIPRNHTSNIIHHQSYIKHVPNPYLWQGRTGFALPAMQHSPKCRQDLDSVDKRLSAAEGRTDGHALQSPSPHLPEGGGGSHRPASGGALTGFPSQCRSVLHETWKCLHRKPETSKTIYLLTQSVSPPCEGGQGDVP